ncbi:relaxase/mobilization nuclease domain-containing protein [Nocardia niigatensis]
MIPKVHRSSDMVRLLRYLAGPGKANEHTNQRVLAGDLVTASVFVGRVDTARAVEIARLLDSPRQTLLRGEPVLAVSHKKARALMAEGMSRTEAYTAATKVENTWHCSLSLGAEEGQLDDATWAAIAHDFMKEMGFADRDDQVPDARWVAVHHGLSANGNDHIHIAAGAIRPDGSRLDTYRDYSRAQDAARVLERKYGLRVLASREEGGTERGTSQAERARRERTGAPETEREALRRRVRAIAMATGSEAEWLREMRAAGIVVRPRYEAGGTDEVIGYAVRWPAHVAEDARPEKPIWYSGGKLAKDLTLSAIRGWAAWESGPAAREAALTEWRRGLAEKAVRPRRGAEASSPEMQDRVIAELGAWSRYMRTIPVGDRDAWATAASQSAGAFAALSMRTEVRPGPLDRLSRQLARAGQQPAHTRRPHNVHGSGLRSVARMLWAAQSPQASQVALATALVECLTEIGRMLEASDRAHAAAAMASTARRALTEIHMRAEGIDPTRPYRRETGSPAWACAMRAAVVVDGGDRGENERVIAEAAKQWDIQRLMSRVRPGGERYDEKGRILGPSDAQRTADVQEALDATSGPRTPSTGRSRVRGVDPALFGKPRRPGDWAAMRDGTEELHTYSADPDTSAPEPSAGPARTPETEHPAHGPYRAPESNPRHDRDHGR